MTITLRQRKKGKSGKISLYLEIYHGTSTTEDGKIKYHREFQYLNMYLIDKPKTEADKQQNKETLHLAKQIKNKYELEYNTGRFGLQPLKNKHKDTNFYDYYFNFVKKKSKTLKKSTQRSWTSALKIFEKFRGKAITFSDVNKKFCNDFMEYLQERILPDGEKPMNSSINNQYFYFSSVIRSALEDKIITENPLPKTKRLKVKKTKKIYLTLEELRSLVKTDCKYPILKNAFLFSCLTGLRWSDVSKLTWEEIEETDGEKYLVYTQKKTDDPNRLLLSEQAINYLGERSEFTDKIFNLPKYDTFITQRLRIWCGDAGVNKKITFHSSRHNFAA